MINNIYCIGRNYKLHAEELGNTVPEKPLVFLVNGTSIRSFESGKMAFEKETFHFEAELVLKIGTNHNLNDCMRDNSIEAIAFGIDLTRRAEQNKLKEKGYPWTTSKSFLGSSILGPFYPIGKFKDLSFLQYEFYLDNVLRQKGNTQNMIFSFKELIKYINTFSPLKKGDLIFTGTPEGVGEIVKGQSFCFKFPQLAIEEFGVL